MASRIVASAAWLPLLLVGAPLFAAEKANDLPGQDFFTRKVRPILAGHCFKCHGPDEKARKAGLRLDLRKEATRPGRSGKTPITPGKPEKSGLVRRVFSPDSGQVMPPPHAKNPLTEG